MTMSCGAVTHSLRIPGLKHQLQGFSKVWFGHSHPCRPSAAGFLAQHLLIASPESFSRRMINQLWVKIFSLLQSELAGVLGWTLSLLVPFQKESAHRFTHPFIRSTKSPQTLSTGSMCHLGICSAGLSGLLKPQRAPSSTQNSLLSLLSHFWWRLAFNLGTGSYQQWLVIK